MSTNDPVSNGVTPHASPNTNKPKRKISILDGNNDHHAYESPNRSRKVSSALQGHDNYAFESPARSRKVSTASEHAEIGPVRKKSNIHNYNNNTFDGHTINMPPRVDSSKHLYGDQRLKKLSTTSTYSRNSRSRYSEGDENEYRSWWYLFCIKCRSEESLPQYQPSVWPKVCPYPFCPSYRQFTRIVTLTLICLLSWCVLYAIVGDTAAPPNGRLFQLILLAICAHFGGWLVSLTTLPALIGMLFTGLLLQNVGFVNIDDTFSEITKELRKVALVIILIRAGLDLDPNALKRLKFTVIKLSLVPWIVEAAIATILGKFLLGMGWNYALLLGSMIAAVSPAVVVPCLFRLRAKGYGVAKGIPTLIIAVAGIADASSVAVFGIIKSIMFSSNSITSVILQGPVSIVGGMGFGVVWGLFSNYAPERHDPFVVPLRILLLLVGGTVSVFGSELIGYGGAGPLACVTAAFVSILCWTKQGWDIEDNPAATAFEIFWMIFEPILFSVTGAQIRLNELEGHVVSIGVGILVLGVVIRIISTCLVGIGCHLNWKEKVFVSIAWMSKATVQAALGPIALGMITDKTSNEYTYSEQILTICILSILLTAPTGALLITVLGPKLLTKTKVPIDSEGYRKSHRPSIRDISIIDEEEERDTTGNIDSIMSSANSKPGDLTRSKTGSGKFGM